MLEGARTLWEICGVSHTTDPNVETRECHRGVKFSRTVDLNPNFHYVIYGLK